MPNLMQGATDPYAPFHKRLGEFARELDLIGAGDIEALHRARVASRRVREWLPLLELDRDLTRTLARRLRQATKQFGIVRELDVLMLLTRELAQHDRYPARALAQIGALAAHENAAARKRLAVKLPAARLERLARKLARVSKHLESDAAESGRRRGKAPRHIWLWALEARLVRRAAGVRAAVVAAGAVYAPEQLHGVRIAVKKLRYAAELAAETTRKPFDAAIEALKAAQDLLGRLHDLDVLLRRVRQAQASLSPPDLAAWRDLSSLADIVEDDCRTLHARYMRDRANLTAVANRIGAGTGEPRLAGRRTAS
jgi:CHAD domain-containing protein